MAAGAGDSARAAWVVANARHTYTVNGLTHHFALSMTRDTLLFV